MLERLLKSEDRADPLFGLEQVTKGNFHRLTVNRDPVGPGT